VSSCLSAVPLFVLATAESSVRAAPLATKQLAGSSRGGVPIAEAAACLRNVLLACGACHHHHDRAGGRAPIKIRNPTFIEIIPCSRIFLHQAMVLRICSNLELEFFSVSMCFINSYNLVFTSRTSITQFINNN
jgi:hypothetical protein